MKKFVFNFNRKQRNREQRLTGEPSRVSKLRHFSVLYALLLGAAAFLNGCCCRPDPTGQIYLDHGEVFTRQRLVNDRLVNLNWLSAALSNTPTGFTLQGGQFRSESSAIAGGLSGQVNPLGGAAMNDEQQLLNSATQVGLLQNQVTMAALNSQLTNGTWTNPAAGTPVATNAASAWNLVSSFAPSNNISSGPVTISVNTGVPTNVAAGNFVPGISTSPQLTSVETLQDELAYRNAVAGEMQEQELDDTHDQDGMTLYTLAFHISLAPGRDNQYFGHVAATFTNTELDGVDAKVTKQDYEAWLNSFRATFDHEVISIQRRYLQRLISDDEMRQVIVDGWHWFDEIKYTRRAELSAKLEAAHQQLDDKMEEFTNAFEFRNAVELERAEPRFNFNSPEGRRLEAASDRLKELRDHLSAFDPNDIDSPALRDYYIAKADLDAARELHKEWVNAQPAATNAPPKIKTKKIAAKADVAGVTEGDPDFQAYDRLKARFDQATNEFDHATAVIEGKKDVAKLQASYAQATNEMDCLASLLPDEGNPGATIGPVTNFMKALCWVEIERFQQLNQLSDPLFYLGAPRLVHTQTNDFMFLVPVD